MDADARFELFEWQGLHARTAGFSVEGGEVMKRMRANGIQASLGLGGVRRGVWEVSGVRVNQLDVELDTTGGGGTLAEDEEAEGGAVVDDVGGGSGLLDGLLPDRAEVSSVQVASMNLDLMTDGGGLKVTDVMMRVEGGGGEGVYDVDLTGGVIDTSWFGSPLELMSARGKFKGGRMFLMESRSRVYGRGLLTLEGEVEGGDFGFYGVLSDVRSEELVPEDWQKRITGDLTTQFQVWSGRQDGEAGTVVRGGLELKGGVLTALPVLDRIAAYANTRRFRRLNLSEARLKFRRQGEVLELTDVVLASEGLVRVTGRLTVDGDRLDGRFRVGIMPGLLAHVPGAETKVFLRGEKGLLWSPLRITGTVDDPREDLSRRMIAAAGERMFEVVPETGKMALKFAHETVTGLPSSSVDATGKVLEGDPVGAVEEGADIIRKGVDGVLDLIPGGSRRDGEVEE